MRNPYDQPVIPTSHVVTRAVRRLLGFGVVALVATGALPTAAAAATATVPAPPAVGPTAAGASGLPTPPTDVADCPWLASAMAAGDTPEALAQLVLARMTLAEKLGEIVLESSGDYENVNAGVGRLCIPSLTLSDGPWGLAFGDTGVTQLPVPLAIGATFNTSLSEEYGELLGAEARGQGIDVSQGPNLNIDRVPTSGRADESYGEDPLLTTQMGLADIQGMQARGVMAEAKHLVAYSQETNRGALDAEVPSRALQEIYLPPFKAAVIQGHVASLMCAYPRLDGTFQCQDPAIGLVLQQWGFAGFVRSDLGAVHDQTTSLESGVQLLKPSSMDWLTGLVAGSKLPLTTVDDDVARVLTEMFAYGVIGRPATGSPGTVVNVPSHTDFALEAAEQSAVLLKNQSSLLPLDPSTVGSVAVIGADASTRPVTQGFGSSHVVPPFTSTPLAALADRFAPGATVRYAEGGSTTRHLPTVPTRYLAPLSGKGHGLTLSVGPAAGPGQTITTIDPEAAAAVHPAASATPPPSDRVRSNPPADRPTRNRSADAGRLPDLDPTAAGATSIELPANWPGSKVSWSGTLTVPRSGRYVFSLAGTGAAGLTLDGHPAVVDEVTHDTGTWSGSIVLAADHHYRLSLNWTPVADATSLDVASILDLGMAYVGDAIAQAVAAARASKVAVVFAADYSAETFDRPDLSLPGDQNALIAAVAAANPHTVVVLNTGGPGGDAVAVEGGGGHRGLVPGRRGRRGHRRRPGRGGRPLGAPAGHLPDQHGHVGRADPGPVAGDRPDVHLLGRTRRRLPVQPRHRYPAPVPLRLRSLVHHVLVPARHRGPPERRVRRVGGGRQHRPAGGNRRGPGLPHVPQGGRRASGPAGRLRHGHPGPGRIPHDHLDGARRPAVHLPDRRVGDGARYVPDRGGGFLGVPADRGVGAGRVKRPAFGAGVDHAVGVARDADHGSPRRPRSGPSSVDGLRIGNLGG